MGCKPNFECDANRGAAKSVNKWSWSRKFRAPSAQGARKSRARLSAIDAKSAKRREQREVQANNKRFALAARNKFRRDDNANLERFDGWQPIMMRTVPNYARLQRPKLDQVCWFVPSGHKRRKRTSTGVVVAMLQGARRLVHKRNAKGKILKGKVETLEDFVWIKTQKSGMHCVPAAQAYARKM